MLLHDIFLKDDSFRTGISDSSLCSCGEEKESVENVLLHCCENMEARSVMLDYVSDICKSHCQMDITESLLLTLYSQSKADTILTGFWYLWVVPVDSYQSLVPATVTPITHNGTSRT